MAEADSGADSERRDAAAQPAPRTLHDVAASELAGVFADGGPLSRAIEGWRSRPQQVDMAARIATAIQQSAVFVCEAGTGTGKTVAYLAPALLSGAKVIISTGTKTLQDQLFHRDLPTVRDALGVPVTAALLKGRANYVCHYHLQHNLLDGRLPDRDSVSHLQKIVRFAKQTKRGDRSEFPDVPEDSPAWALATSTRDNCLGGQCPDHERCFVMAARRDALAADVVVVNHHLFFADIMLRDEGLTELLPSCNAVILDEAHQLPDTATLFFGDSVSTAQIIELARDARVAGMSAAKDDTELLRRADGLEKAARDLRLTLPRDTRRTGRELDGNLDFRQSVAGAESACAQLAAALRAVAERDKGLASCAERAEELLARLRNWRGSAVSEQDADEADQANDGELVRWAETHTHALVLHATPLRIAPIFKRQLQGRPRAWIFTSATLAVGGKFDHYLAELGLDGEGDERADTACWDSPFDYQTNGLFYLPKGLPDPNSREHTEAVVNAALPAIRASGGRAFLLFTTLRAMRYAHELLAQNLKGGLKGADLPLLLQGEGSKSELLDRFRRLGNAVLVASSSFWEGVDVRGEALSLVVIDKLPFAPPDDPVLQARLDRMKSDGRNPFMEYQLPQAAIALKQGAGRLIRDEADRGVLMICDPRLVTKPYGRIIVASLPPMKRTRDLAEVQAFFQR